MEHRPGSGALQLWRRLVPAALVLAGLGIFLAAFRGTPAALVSGDFLILAASLVAGASCARAGARGGPNAKAWTFMAAASFVWAAGMAVYAFYGLLNDHVYPFPSLADALFLGYSVPAVMALFSFKRRAGTPVVLFRAVMDAGVVAGSVLVVSWYTALGPAFNSVGDPLTRLTGMAYPVVDLVITSLVLVLAMRRQPGERLPWLCFGGGLVVLAVTDSIYVRMTFDGVTGTTGSPLALGWIAAFLLIALAPAAPYVENTGPDRKGYTLALELLPYVPLLLAVLLFAGPHLHELDPFLIVVGTAVLASVLVRQVLIVFENISLTGGLENEVAARTVELEAAREAAMESSRLKSEFLATMSHEIRTPMNGVVGLTALLLETGLDETQRQYAQGVKGAGESLLALINDILDFSKLEAGKVDLDIRPFDPRVLVEEVAALLAEPALAKNLELIAYCEPDVPARLQGDSGRIRQILLNLASNAVKFTTTGEVSIRVTTQDPGAGPGSTATIHFEVRDTGIGISAEHQGKLFESFSQADASTTRRYGGTGLGLAICRRLTTVMDGAIGLDSAPGQGSTFWFRLPLPIAPPSTDPVPAAGFLNGLRVLVVDDNATNRLVLESQLRGWRLQPQSVPDATAALELARAAGQAGAPFHLAVLDYCMPDTDGLELARRIKADPALASMELIMLTSTMQVDPVEIAAAGVREWLMKPVRSSEFYNRLVRLISTREGMPQSWSNAGPPQPAQTQGRGPHRGQILVVEDNEVNQLVARATVEKFGYAVDVVSNGAEAVAATAATRYAAVLMDCHMPVMDGFEATREIRRRPGATRLPIIAMTAGALDGDRERCLAAGMDDYLSKPVDGAALEAALARWVPGQLPQPLAVTGGPAAPAGQGPALDQNRLAVLRELGQDDGGALLRATVKAFQRDSLVRVAALRAAVPGDSQVLMQAAHALKGSAANIGAGGVVAVCAELEELGRSGRPGNGAGLVSRLEAELRRLDAELEVAVKGDQ
ncbi:response regulator [Pseudarthrobacter sp. BRE9]|uniref:response regulator n=1 Tax=Pseudarthrobacter sp. BRE9 TaxID=2962582 RepID=UPI002881298A|nr:response regulator [Pseudarthrobacter sp. BRE9]MDT0169679.1 response regulator [Pseudarthrobacter sp. BRE9]